jgi:hypothetical protein
MLFLAPAVLGQADTPIQGTVVTREGKPIEGVHVYGSQGRCCPVWGEQTVTNKEGQFRLERPETVIHFFQESLQPQSIVIRPGRPIVPIVMNPATNAMTVPDCGPLQPGQRRIGSGPYALQFTISGLSLRIDAGDAGLDYVGYVIRRTQSQSSMSVSFGMFDAVPDPDDDRFIASSDYVQRLLFVQDGLFHGRVAGLDSRGHLRGGGSWRHTAVGFVGEADYTKASTEDTVAFDQVIDSMCFVPLPQPGK